MISVHNREHSLCLARFCMAVIELASVAETVLLKLFCKIPQNLTVDKITLT